MKIEKKMQEKKIIFCTKNKRVNTNINKCFIAKYVKHFPVG